MVVAVEITAVVIVIGLLKGTAVGSMILPAMSVIVLVAAAKVLGEPSKSPESTPVKVTVATGWPTEWEAVLVECEVTVPLSTKVNC